MELPDGLSGRLRRASPAKLAHGDRRGSAQPAFELKTTSLSCVSPPAPELLAEAPLRTSQRTLGAAPLSRAQAGSISRTAPILHPSGMAPAEPTLPPPQSGHASPALPSTAWNGYSMVALSPKSASDTISALSVLLDSLRAGPRSGEAELQRAAALAEPSGAPVAESAGPEEAPPPPSALFSAVMLGAGGSGESGGGALASTGAVIEHGHGARGGHVAMQHHHHTASTAASRAASSASDVDDADCDVLPPLWGAAADFYEDAIAQQQQQSPITAPGYYGHAQTRRRADSLQQRQRAAGGSPAGAEGSLTVGEASGSSGAAPSMGRQHAAGQLARASSKRLRPLQAGVQAEATTASLATVLMRSPLGPVPGDAVVAPLHAVGADGTAVAGAGAGIEGAALSLRDGRTRSCSTVTRNSADGHGDAAAAPAAAGSAATQGAATTATRTLAALDRRGSMERAPQRQASMRHLRFAPEDGGAAGAGSPSSGSSAAAIPGTVSATSGLGVGGITGSKLAPPAGATAEAVQARSHGSSLKLRPAPLQHRATDSPSDARAVIGAAAAGASVSLSNATPRHLAPLPPRGATDPASAPTPHTAVKLQPGADNLLSAGSSAVPQQAPLLALPLVPKRRPGVALDAPSGADVVGDGALAYAPHPQSSLPQSALQHPEKLQAPLSPVSPTRYGVFGTPSAAALSALQPLPRGTFFPPGDDEGLSGDPSAGAARVPLGWLSRGLREAGSRALGGSEGHHIILNSFSVKLSREAGEAAAAAQRARSQAAHDEALAAVAASAAETMADTHSSAWSAGMASGDAGNAFASPSAGGGFDFGPSAALHAGITPPRSAGGLQQWTPSGSHGGGRRRRLQPQSGADNSTADVSPGFHSGATMHPALLRGQAAGGSTQALALASVPPPLGLRTASSASSASTGTGSTGSVSRIASAAGLAADGGGAGRDGGWLRRGGGASGAFRSGGAGAAHRMALGEPASDAAGWQRGSYPQGQRTFSASAALDGAGVDTRASSAGRRPEESQPAPRLPPHVAFQAAFLSGGAVWRPPSAPGWAARGPGAVAGRAGSAELVSLQPQQQQQPSLAMPASPQLPAGRLSRQTHGTGDISNDVGAAAPTAGLERARTGPSRNTADTGVASVGEGVTGGGAGTAADRDAHVDRLHAEERAAARSNADRGVEEAREPATAAPPAHASLLEREGADHDAEVDPAAARSLMLRPGTAVCDYSGLGLQPDLLHAQLQGTWAGQGPGQGAASAADSRGPIRGDRSAAANASAARTVGVDAAEAAGSRAPHSAPSHRLSRAYGDSSEGVNEAATGWE